MDLAITASLLACSAHILFHAGERIGARLPLSSRFLGFSFAALGLWLAWSSNLSFRWADWIPHGSVLLLANASVLLLVLAGGLFFGSHPRSLRERWCLSTALSITAAFFICVAIWRPLNQPIDFQLRNSWDDQVCLQTHPSTCAPAAVATLVGQAGIQTTEQRMAKACLTSKEGTLALGSYRGALVATRGSDFSPRVVNCEPASYPIQKLNVQLPMLAHVNFEAQLDESLVVPQHFTGRSSPAGAPNTWSGVASSGHVVVILERLADGRYLVADPAVGRVRWTADYFRSVWVGEGIYLVSR